MSVDLITLTALLVAHFLVDFPLQYPYQWMNKGTYGHPGGIVHAGLHFGASTVILAFVTTYPAALLLGFINGVVHYHIDWAKMNINRIMGWKCDKHAQFWTLTGFDQLLHQLTLVAIVVASGQI